MAATASSDTTVSLPPETLELIARHTLRGRLPSLRLACSQFAFAADPCVTSLSVKANQWPHAPPAVSSRLQHVRCMSAVLSCPAHWHQLFQLSAQLPKLSHLRLPDHSSSNRTLPPTMPTFNASSLSSLTRLDLATARRKPISLVLQPPEGVQLPGLKAASFDGVSGLWRIARFAPNLEQLYCEILKLYSEDADNVLPACTHYAGTNVIIASNSEQPMDLMAAEFSKAFPNLQVLTNAPAFGQHFNQLGMNGVLEVVEVSSADVLQHCTSLRAIKALGTFARGCHGSGSLQQLQQLPQLTRLSLHNPREQEAALDGIGQLTQLQHLRLTFSERQGGYEEVETLNLSSQLAQQLASLPQLQTLALPAELLIEHWHRLLDVAASSSSLTRLDFLETWRNVEEFWGIDRYWDALGDGECEFRAAVDALYQQKVKQQHAQAQQQGQQQGQQQQQAQAQQQAQQQGQQAQPCRKLHIPEQRGRQYHNTCRDEKLWLQAYDGSQGVWGIYGAAGEW